MREASRLTAFLVVGRCEPVCKAAIDQRGHQKMFLGKAQIFFLLLFFFHGEPGPCKFLFHACISFFFGLFVACHTDSLARE